MSPDGTIEFCCPELEGLSGPFVVLVVSEDFSIFHVSLEQPHALGECGVLSKPLVELGEVIDGFAVGDGFSDADAVQIDEADDWPGFAGLRLDKKISRMQIGMCESGLMGTCEQFCQGIFEERNPAGDIGIGLGSQVLPVIGEGLRVGNTYGDQEAIDRMGRIAGDGVGKGIDAIDTSQESETCDSPFLDAYWASKIAFDLPEDAAAEIEFGIILPAGEIDPPDLPEAVFLDQFCSADGGWLGPVERIDVKFLLNSRLCKFPLETCRRNRTRRHGKSVGREKIVFRFIVCFVYRHAGSRPGRKEC